MFYLMRSFANGKSMFVGMFFGFTANDVLYK